jgi:hypothetical protein
MSSYASFFCFIHFHARSSPSLRFFAPVAGIWPDLVSYRHTLSHSQFSTLHKDAAVLESLLRQQLSHSLVSAVAVEVDVPTTMSS